MAQGRIVTNDATGEQKWWDGKSMSTPTPQQLTSATTVKATPADEAGLTTLTGQYQIAQMLSDRADEFMKTQGSGPTAVATGPAYGDLPVPGFDGKGGNLARAYQNVAAWAGGSPANSDANRLKALDSINNQTWTAMRPPGSGPIRAFEATGWKTAFPNTSTGGDANEAMRQRLNSEAAKSSAQLAFTSRFIRSGQGNLGDAALAWNAQQKGAKAPGASQPTTVAPTPRQAAQAAPSRAAAGGETPAQYHARLAAQFGGQ